MSFDEYTNAIAPTGSAHNETETPAATLAFPAIALAQSIGAHYFTTGLDISYLKLKTELPKFFKFTDTLIDPVCE